MTGRELRENRKKFKLNQTELGSYLGISYGTVSRWERERYFPKPIFVEKIKGFFTLLERQQIPQRADQSVQDDSSRDSQNSEPYQGTLTSRYNYHFKRMSSNGWKFKVRLELEYDKLSVIDLFTIVRKVHRSIKR